MIEKTLNQSTKTNKMKQLFELGLTRKQIAELLGVNYGFAHNVYVGIIESVAERKQKFCF